MNRKKWISILISMVLLLCMLALTGCGTSEPGKEVTEETVTEPAPEISTEAPSEVVTESPTEAATEAPTETEPDPNDFDKTWAGEDLEMPIPEPPFTAEVEYDAERGTYDIRSTDVDEVIEIDIQLFKDYCESLKAIGFTDSLRESELEAGDYTGYEFYAERNGSQCVMLIHDGRSCMIMVIVQE